MHLDALAEGVSQADILDGQSQELVLRYPERFWEWIATNRPSWQEISRRYDRQWVWALRTCFWGSANPKASTKELKRLLTSVRMSLACFSVKSRPLSIMGQNAKESRSMVW